MGSSSKKKDKKKKRKREHADDEYYSERKENKRKYENDYTDDYKRSHKDVALTEEYVYDHAGERIRGERDMSLSPEGHKKDMTPPPLPPGMDWPFEASKAKRSSSSRNEDWKVNDDKNRDREYQDNVDRKLKEKQKENKKKEEPPKPSGNEESLSIEETNKLRAKLGLKPLQVDDGSSGKEEKGYADRDDVHKPAVNISEIKSADKMREKMESIREKRKINKKLQKVKGLGEADDEDPALDSAAAWVAKSRQLAREKELANKRAQLLEEMDDEFGVSDLIAETARKIKKEPEYSSRDLKGMRVEHKGRSFVEGLDTVLTLKDKDVLDEENEDVLVNVNIIDDEKAKQNVLNKRKGPAYKAYDEEDEDTGQLKIRGLLDKYDEEIDGIKKSSFRIDGSGKADLEGENEMEKIRATLKAHQVSLEIAAPQLARDYFTEEEMVKFKKPRKKIKKVVRKRNVVKADDLLKLDIDSNADRGSRNKKSAIKKKYSENQEEVGMDIVTNVPDELDYFVALNMKEEGTNIVMEEDEAEKELQLALERSRRSKVKSETIKVEDIGEKLSKEVMNLPKDESDKVEAEPSVLKSKRKRGPIVMDSTSEFCRTLGELPTLGPPPPVVKEEPQPSHDDIEIEVNELTAMKGGWEQVEMNPIDGGDEKEKDENDEDVLEPEPLPTGMVSTLTLANMKGYLKDGKEKVRRFDPLNLPETKAEIDMEKLRDEEKNRYSSRGYDRERYDPYAFKEKSGYKPDVKLEYVDSKGRSLNQKEAFRLLSHKFHGKGSGKLKTEKRAKKVIEQKKLQKMSSIDTPLNTAAMFKEKQKQGQTPFIVLSGGGKNLLSSDGLKK